MLFLVFFNIPYQISEKSNLLVQASSIQDLISKSVHDIITTFKSKYCCECTQSVAEGVSGGNRELMMSLPCDCTICSEWCLNSYLKKMIQDEENRCLCGERFSHKDFLSLFSFCAINKLTHQTDVLHKVILHKFQSTCCLCLNKFDLYSDTIINKIYFEDSEFKTLLHDKKFQHILCDDCYEGKKMKENVVFLCIMCEKNHQIIKIKKKINIMKKDEDCCIF